MTPSQVILNMLKEPINRFRLIRLQAFDFFLQGYTIFLSSLLGIRTHLILRPVVMTICRIFEHLTYNFPFSTSIVISFTFNKSWHSILIHKK
ncbi:hypothetical protein BJI67_04250 [Acidihalobacter aeolianus]|uniref:Uncharacterized protein n=1 Tax=Acidihalobacter aeolianus TaxID=2792603 RepID=A0A1D8K5Z7_9GAMM|nr:hypothetical protein BJI67_04250 [Acidihalobacter aeolianus]